MFACINALVDLILHHSVIFGNILYRPNNHVTHEINYTCMFNVSIIYLYMSNNPVFKLKD